MKKNILLLLSAFTISASFAQFKKGDKIIETSLGNINIGSTKDNTGGGDGKAKSFKLSIEFASGYFLHPDVAVGTRLNTFLALDNITSKNSNGVKVNDTKSGQMGILLAPFIRYYFKQNAKSRFYGQLAGYFSTTPFYNFTANAYNSTTGALVSTTKTDNFKSNRTGVTPSLGWNYFFSSHTALNLNLGYSFYNNKSSDKITTTPVNGQPYSSTSTSNPKTSELNWNIGFMFLLPNKKSK